MELKKAIQIINSKGVTAYEIHKETSLNEAGIRRVLKEEVLNPQRKTKDALISFAEGLLSKTTSSKENISLEIEGIPITIDKIAHLIAKHEEEFMKQKIFSNIIEIRVAKRIADITLSKETLIEYLKN
jgi:hypothetical protein